MGKSSKKSTTKVETAPVAVAKSGKKGKRSAEEAVDKAVGAKKLKLEKDEAVEAKKKLEKKQLKKVETSSSSEEDSSSDSDDEPKVQATKESSSPDSDESSEDESDDESEDEKPVKTPKKKDTDVEMLDAVSPAQKTPKTPTTLQSQSTGSKRLFMANLSFSVEENDVREFFKSVGEVVDIQFASSPEGQFKGFGHVEFATAEAAQKALEELNGEELLNRPVKLDIARERGAYTPGTRDNNKSFQKGGRGQGSTAFVKGFDTSLGEDEIRSTLQEHFGSCGHIMRLSIPPNYETGGVKGMAYIDFADSNGFNKALELDGTDLGGGFYLTVNEAKPKGDFSGGRGGGRSGGRSGGRDSGGRFGGRGGGGRSGGRSGGRDSGGRFGGRGGGGRSARGGGRGGRGGRMPNRPSFGASATGRKTKFADDE